MSLPLLRTPLPQTHSIRLVECIVGYIVILAVMPLLARLAFLATGWMFKGSGVTRTSAGPALAYGHQMLENLSMSFLFSWMGCILSIPIVLAARRFGWFGIIPAMATGVLVMLVVFGFPFAGFIQDVPSLLADLGLPSALLGLSFWLTVRLLRPSAFRTTQP